MAKGQDHQEDMAHLSLIVSEALNGVDIPTRYPAFFQRMLADDEVRDAFLDALAVLEMEERGQLAPLPEPPAADLSFLQTAAARPVVKWWRPGEWAVTWKQTQAALERLFFAPEPSAGLVYRREETYLENAYLTLLRSDVDVEGERVDLLLEAQRAAETPDLLTLLLAVSVVGAWRPLQATIEWGAYQATVVINRQGQATFPPFSLNAILDEDGWQVTAALDLHLRPAP